MGFNLSISGSGLFMAMAVFTTAMAGGDDDSEIRTQSEGFVISTDGCAFTDGYRCGDLLEDNFLSVDSQKNMISGNLLKALKVALTNFQSQPDQTPQQTDLKHFKVGLTENTRHYIVLFQGLLMPRVEDGQVTGLTRVPFGRTTKYWISKDAFKIDKRLFYK